MKRVTKTGSECPYCGGPLTNWDPGNGQYEWVKCNPCLDNRKPAAFKRILPQIAKKMKNEENTQ